jgi:hypothetical protein
MKKIFLAFAVIFALLPVTANAITFVSMYGYATGEVTAFDGEILYLREDERVRRFSVAQEIYVLGAEIETGDTITVYFRMIDTVTSHIEGADMIPSPGWFPVETIPVAFVVNGDYDVYVGEYRGGEIRNGVATQNPVPLDASEFPAKGIRDGDGVAVLLGENRSVERAIVIYRHTEWEIEIFPAPGNYPYFTPRFTLHREPRLFLSPDIEIHRPDISAFEIEVRPPLSCPTLSAWAVTPVTTAVFRGIVPEHLQENFNQPITRAEFADLVIAAYSYIMGGTLLEAELAGRVPEFADTNNINVRIAAYLGLISGVGGGNFDPYAPLTREQAAVILARFAEIVLESPMTLVFFTFNDATEISYWAESSIQALANRGIMSGVGGNRFAPQGTFTREQSITTVKQIFDLWHHR